MSQAPLDRNALRREVIDELREAGMQYDVMDYDYEAVGEVRAGEDFPTGAVPEDVFQRLRTSAPAVYTHHPVACPLCAYVCRDCEFALADRAKRIVYTYLPLLFHLIEEHHYLPPRGFLDCVDRHLRSPEADRPAHDAPPAIRAMQSGTLPFHPPQPASERAADETNEDESFPV